MKAPFTYSILQYKHSPLLREAINVGVLFAFPDDDRVRFSFGNSFRLRSIYPNFDSSLFAATIKHINSKISDLSKDILFKNSSPYENFIGFINANLLSEDATVLQFSQPIKAVSISDIEDTVRSYTKLLLPGLDIEKSNVVKHNEAYIIREYTKYLSEGFSPSHIENRIKRNFPVEYKGVPAKFDLSWKYGTTNLVKAVSFDLKESADIHNKCAQWFGTCTLLAGYAEKHECRFDLLVSKPTDRKLWKDYDKVLVTLYDINAPKKIVKESELKTYSEETRQYLLQL